MDIHNQNDYNLVYSALQTKFLDGVKSVPAGAFKPIYEEVQSNTRQNVYNWLNFIPTMRKWKRSAPRLFRNVNVQDYAVINETYETTIEIPKEDFEDEQVAQYSMLASLMGKNAALLPDQIIANLLAASFSAVTIDGESKSTKTYDNEFWFSASHTIGLSTINNLRTGVLTPANFGEARRAIKAFRVKADEDSSAVPVAVNAKLVLMVPSALESAGEAIIENEYNNFGATNQYYNKAELVVNPWLDQFSETAWFLFNVGAGLMPVLYQNRQAPQLIAMTPFNSDRAFTYKSLIWGIDARGAACPTFPFLAIGSTGLTA
jgi:phage major head subunit gpT-like protein